MSHLDWDQLPGPVRAAITEHTGPIEQVVPAADGAASDLAVTVHTVTGRVFVKGVRGDHPAAWMLRNQTRFTRVLPAEVTPPLLWSAEPDGWLLIATDHLDGRHPSLAPGSPDLPAVADALTRFAAVLTPAPHQPCRSLADRWRRLPGWALIADDPALTDQLNPATRSQLAVLVELEAAAPGRLDGDTLAHTDPVLANIMLTRCGPRMLDWSFPALAPAWTDTAFLVPRLLDAGHTPQQAERWAATIPAYAAADPDAVSAFAAALAGLWTYRTLTAPNPRQTQLASIARRWAHHRTTLVTTWPPTPSPAGSVAAP